MDMPLQNYQFLIRIFTQCMWVFDTPHSSVVTINAPAQVEPCFVSKKIVQNKKTLLVGRGGGWNIVNYRN